MFYDWNAFWRAHLASIFTFYTIHHVCLKLIKRKDERQDWKHVNIATSFIHSVLSSFFAIYCFIENPKMLISDMISSFTPTAYSFVSFEIGYFVYDMIDMLKNSSGRQTYEVVLHHLTIIICFGISLYRGSYVGYCVLSLFIEINSIFLHLRQLYLFWKKSKQAPIFRLISMTNLVTFVIFRFGIITYMSIWLIINRVYIPLFLVLIGQTGLLVMTIMNVYLFSRLLKSDFYSRRD